MEETDDLNEFDVFLSQKKKKKKLIPLEEDPNDPAEEGDYSYIFLLERLKHQQQLDSKENSSYTSNSSLNRFTLPHLELTKYGSKKICWNNFVQVCERMQRQRDLVKKFVESETGFSCSIGAPTKNECLIFHGLIKQKGLEILVQKFMRDFVTCKSCKKSHSRLIKDRVTRLYFVICDECNSQFSAPPIRASFHAKTRADRKKERV